MVADINIKLTAQDVSAGAFRSYKSNIDSAGMSLTYLDRSAQAASAGNAALVSSLKLAAAGLTAMSIVDKADGWGQYASRVRMATQSEAEYDHVQGRMQESARNTYRAISETREGFIQMSPVLRQMGLDIDQSIDVIDTFSGLLVVNSASSEKGASAQDAFNKALQKGKVEADAWATITAAMPSIVDEISASTGKSTTEIRKLGVEGKLSINDLVSTLVGRYQPVMAKVAEMPTTVRDSLQSLVDAASEYIGKNNESMGATAKLASGIGFLSENFESLATVGMAAAIAAGSRYAVNVGLVTAATVAKTVASRQAAAAELQGAQAQAVQTAATVAQTRALAGLGVTRAQILVAEAAHEASLKRLAVAQGAYASAARIALGALTGPVGLAVMAATAAASWLMFRDGTDAAKQSLLDIQQPLDDVRKKFNDLTKDQQRGAVASAKATADEAIAEAERMYRTLRGLSAQELFPTMSDGIAVYQTDQKGLDSFLARLDEARSKGQSLTDVLRTTSAAGRVSPAVLASLDEQASKFSTAEVRAADLSSKADTLSAALNATGVAAKGAAAGVDLLNAAANEAIDKQLGTLAKRVALFGDKTSGGEIRYELTLGDKGAYAGATEEKKKSLLAVADYLDKLEKTKDAETKSAAAAKTAASAKKTEQERVTKAASEYVDKLQEQLDGVKEMTAWDKVWYDLANGSIVLSGKQVDKAFELANAVDAKKESEEEAARVLNHQNALLSAQRDLMAQIDGYDVELTSMGMGQKAAEEMQGRLQIMQTYVARIRDLEDQQRNALASNTDPTKADGIRDQYDAQIRVQQQYQSRALDEYSQYVDRKTALESDWSIGASQAWQNYLDSASNMASQSEELATRAFTSMEDALVEFATTGKLSFKSLADSIIADLVRIQMRQMMTSAISSSGIMSSLAGIAGGLFGGASTGLASATAADVAAAGDGLMFLSEGGFTGPGGKYEPKGLVHGGEFVINAASTSKLGLGFLEQLNGYADGGYVADAPVAVRGLSARPAPVKAAAPIVVSPTIYIDSRSDQAQIHDMVQAGVEAAIAQAFDMQTRGVS